MKLLHVREITSKIIRSLSYSSLTLQWLWMLVIIVPPLIKSGVFDFFNMPLETQAPRVSSEPLVASPLVWTIVGILTLIILVATVIVLIRLPKAVVQTGERFVHQAAEVVIPAITHHKHLPANKQRILSRRVTLAIQLLATFIPAVTSFFLPAYEDITPAIIVTIALLLTGVSAIGFVLSWFVEPPVQVTSQTRSPASRG